jgi:hypothetical protein
VPPRVPLRLIAVYNITGYTARTDCAYGLRFTVVRYGLDFRHSSQPGGGPPSARLSRHTSWIIRGHRNVANLKPNCRSQVTVTGGFSTCPTPHPPGRLCASALQKTGRMPTAEWAHQQKRAFRPEQDGRLTRPSLQRRRTSPAAPAAAATTAAAPAGSRAARPSPGSRADSSWADGVPAAAWLWQPCETPAAAVTASPAAASATGDQRLTRSSRPSMLTSSAGQPPAALQLPTNQPIHAADVVCRRAAARWMGTGGNGARLPRGVC